MREPRYILVLLGSLTWSQAEETKNVAPELPMCPTGVLSFPSSLPMHCRLPRSIPSPPSPHGSGSNLLAKFPGLPTIPPNFYSNLPKMNQAPQPPPPPPPPPYPVISSPQFPSPIGIPLPPQMPGPMPIVMPSPMMMPPPMPPPPNLPVIVMPFYSPDPHYKKPDSNRKDSREKDDRKRKKGRYMTVNKKKNEEKKRKKGRHITVNKKKDKDKSNSKSKSSCDDSSSGSSDSSGSDSSSGSGSGSSDKDYLRKQARRSMNRRRERKSKGQTRRSYENSLRRMNLLTPVIQYVTDDGYVIYEKEITKNEARNWLSVNNKDDPYSKGGFPGLEDIMDKERVLPEPLSKPVPVNKLSLGRDLNSPPMRIPLHIHRNHPSDNHADNHVNHNSVQHHNNHHNSLEQSEPHGKTKRPTLDTEVSAYKE